MSGPVMIGWDLSPSLCGWAAGDGSKLPIAGAFALEEHEDENLGALGCEFQSRVLGIQRRFDASHWIVEAPLYIPRRDKAFTLKRQYGLQFLLATLACKLNVVLRYVDPDEVKREWAGKGPQGKPATKDQMIAMCVKVGISLPPTKTAGRADAADACGVWKIGVRHYARQYITRWDQALYRRQGGLV